MIVFIIKIALLGLLIYAAFKIIWKAIVAACVALVEGIVGLVAKLKVAIRRGRKAIFVLYRRYTDGRTTKTEIGKEEDVDVLPDELNELLEKQQQVQVKDEETGW